MIYPLQSDSESDVNNLGRSFLRIFSLILIHLNSPCVIERSRCFPRPIRSLQVLYVPAT